MVGAKGLWVSGTFSANSLKNKREQSDGMAYMRTV